MTPNWATPYIYDCKFLEMVLYLQLKDKQPGAPKKVAISP